MKILLDTNIIMDALQERQPFDSEAKDILLGAQNKKFNCYFTANAATDIFYLYSKSRGIAAAKEAISFLLNTYKVVSITREDCLRALSLPIDDFEDALVEACAKKSEINYIISRDEKFIKSATQVKVVSPREFLEMIK